MKLNLRYIIVVTLYLLAACSAIQHGPDKQAQLDTKPLVTIGFNDQQVLAMPGHGVAAESLEVLPAAESLPGDNLLEIVSWNLGAFEPVRDKRYYQLADAIKIMDPELLAIVEVNYSFVASALAMDLAQEGECYDRKIILQPASQDIAVIHKCYVDVSNPRLIPGSDDGNTWLRKALAVDVTSSEFDFVLIAVHMKAGRSRGAREVRTRQASAIASWINDQVNHDNERDFILVGDYNMIPGTLDDETFEALSPMDQLNYISSQYLLDNPNAFTHIKKTGQPGNYLDGFAISNTDTSEYQLDSLEIVDLPAELGFTPHTYVNDVSDHLPMKAKFITDVDDD